MYRDCLTGSLSQTGWFSSRIPVSSHLKITRMQSSVPMSKLYDLFCNRWKINQF